MSSYATDWFPEFWLSPRWRMEIRRLAGDPLHELRNRWMRADKLWIIANPGKLCIGEVGVDCLVADGVYWNSLASLLRLWDGVMPLYQRFKRSPAKPAGEFVKIAHASFFVSFACAAFLRFMVS